MRPIDADVFVINVVKSGFGVEFINKVTGLLIDTPTIEPKQGEWIPNSPYAGLCSECGGEGNLKNSFCPNCGANMKGVDNE